MNEITSAIRLKDRIIIAILLSVFALLIATTAGLIAIVTKDNTPGDLGSSGGDINGGTVDNHTHIYEYHIEKASDGSFNFIGVCTDSACSDPNVTYLIEGGLTAETKVAANCVTMGEILYSFTSPIDNKTYSYTDKTPYTDHDYVGEIVTVDGISTINVSCSVEECTAPDISLDNISLTFERTEEATCKSDRRDYYSFELNGEKTVISTYVESDDILHYLNGKLISEYYIYDNVIAYGTEGIIVNGGITIVGCGSWTAAAYICEECGQTQGAIVGNPPHSYDYDNIEITKLPDFSKDGEAKVCCTNEGCTLESKITLPKAIEGENTTLILTDEENKFQRWTYTFTSDKYDYTFELELETPWEHNHNYVYDATKTKAPTIYRDGEFIVRCTICEQEKKHSLPKINEGFNAEVISEATEQKAKTYSYTYTSDTYGFTEVLEIEVGDKLSHSYTYELVFYNGGFALAGHCANELLGCQEIDVITDEGLVPEKEYVAPTCSQWGSETWYYVKDDVRYEISLALPPEIGIHSFVCDELNTTYPTFENPGSTVLVCSGEGCGVRTGTITLPKAELGTNAIVNEETREVIYTFKVTYEGVDFNVGVAYPLTDEHSHTYTYELVPMESVLGKFDLVGSCTYPLCTSKVKESDVPAQLVEDNSSCTTGINQIWVYNGYECHLDIWVPDGHHMDYVPGSPSTVNPTLTESGSMEIYCTKCGETYTLELPCINDPLVDVEITGDTERQTSYSYVYHYVYNELDPDGYLDIELIILINK